jgi:predicted ATP-grasp superfamily ATP-dependent carboligase
LNQYEHEYSRLDKETFLLAEKIMNTPAHTLAGLRAKALHAVHACVHLWDEPSVDLDWDKEAARSLIEAACALTGLPVPVERVEEAS